MLETIQIWFISDNPTISDNVKKKKTSPMHKADETTCSAYNMAYI